MKLIFLTIFYSRILFLVCGGLLLVTPAVACFHGGNLNASIGWLILSLATCAMAFGTSRAALASELKQEAPTHSMIFILIGPIVGGLGGYVFAGGDFAQMHWIGVVAGVIGAAMSGAIIGFVYLWLDMFLERSRADVLSEDEFMQSMPMAALLTLALIVGIFAQILYMVALFTNWPFQVAA